MTMKNTLLQPEGWVTPKGYANDVAARGTMVFTGGQIGWNAQQQFESDDFIAQTKQTLLNVRLPSLAGWQDNPHLAAETRQVEAELAGAGRVLIRASGTEPVLRVMVESRDAAQGRALAERLVAAAQR